MPSQENVNNRETRKPGSSLPITRQSSEDPSSNETLGWLPGPIRWVLSNDITSTLLAAFVLTFVIRTFIAEPRWIPSESMLPTLEVGDRLVVEKLSYRFSDPNRGDIVVFIPPDHLETNDAFIKRVVGLPGDTIEIRLDEGIYINGEKLDESYIFSQPTLGISYQGDITQLGELQQYPLDGVPFNSPIVVPDDHYFVLGDNRNNSQDSHVWGFLPRENIIGRTFVRFWPFGRLHHFPTVEYPELEALSAPGIEIANLGTVWSYLDSDFTAVEQRQ